MYVSAKVLALEVSHAWGRSREKFALEAAMPKVCVGKSLGFRALDSATPGVCLGTDLGFRSQPRLGYCVPAKKALVVGVSHAWFSRGEEDLAVEVCDASGSRGLSRFRGAPWGCVKLSGAGWGSLGLAGAPWGWLGLPMAAWGSLGLLGAAWGCLGLFGAPGGRQALQKTCKIVPSRAKYCK